MTTPDELTAMLARATPLLEANHRCNRPNPRAHGERVVGFVLPEDVAGLSDGLFMMDALVGVAKALPAHLARIAALEGERDRLREAVVKIKEMTDPDDPESYRNDDREGCLETVFATASAALKETDHG